jgi:hypothetical protein
MLYIPISIVDSVWAALLFTIAFDVCIEVTATTGDADALHACGRKGSPSDSRVRLVRHVMTHVDIIY